MRGNKEMSGVMVMNYSWKLFGGGAKPKGKGEEAKNPIPGEKKQEKKEKAEKPGKKAKEQKGRKEEKETTQGKRREEEDSQSSKGLLQKLEERAREARRKAKQQAEEALWFLRAFITLALACNTLFVGAGILVTPFLVWEPAVAAAVVAILLSLYVPTYFGSPASTGWRKWPAFANGFVIRDIIRWFSGSVSSVASLSPRRKYIFAVAPHGIMV